MFDECPPSVSGVILTFRIGFPEVLCTKRFYVIDYITDIVLVTDRSNLPRKLLYGIAVSFRRYSQQNRALSNPLCRDVTVFGADSTQISRDNAPGGGTL